MVWSVGHEDDDHRMMMGDQDVSGHSLELNNPGLYPFTCVELMVDGLAVTAVLKAHHINDYEGAAGTSVSFDYTPQVGVVCCVCHNCFSRRH